MSSRSPRRASADLAASRRLHRRTGGVGIVSDPSTPAPEGNMAMTQASGAASPAPESDRLRRTSLTSRLLGRPSAGALLITFFVWIVFAVLSAVNGGGVFYSLDGTLNYLDVAAQVGIVGT